LKVDEDGRTQMRAPLE